MPQGNAVPLRRRRRNLKLILELAQDPTAAAPGGDPNLMTAREVDRLAFLFKPLTQRQGSISSLVPAFLSSATLTVDQARRFKITWGHNCAPMALF